MTSANLDILTMELNANTMLEAFANSDLIAVTTTFKEKFVKTML